MEQIELVRKALIDAGYQESGIHLEKTPKGRVTGYLVDGSFRDLDQLERQQRLWEEIRSRLTVDVLASVVSILTMTPEEVTDEDQPHAAA